MEVYMKVEKLYQKRQRYKTKLEFNLPSERTLAKIAEISKLVRDESKGLSMKGKCRERSGQKSAEMSRRRNGLRDQNKIPACAFVFGNFHTVVENFVFIGFDLLRRSHYRMCLLRHNLVAVAFHRILHILRIVAHSRHNQRHSLRIRLGRNLRPLGSNHLA